MKTEYELEQERKKVAEDWAKITANRLVKALRKKGIGYSHSLEYSIAHKLVAMAGGDITSIVHTFDVSGKFVDMGVGRGQKIESVKSNGDVYRLVGGGRKPKKWFSPTYYAETMVLLDLMGLKYGEQGAGIIKEQLDIKL